MMVTTHALAGMLLGSVALFVAPEFAPMAVLAGLAGGAFPDLDLYAGHRKTLHFPVYYSAAALVAVGVAALTPGAWSVGVAVFLLAAALHSASDALGGGLELKPWLGESDRAVYDHFRGRWVAPRRWVRYDGAPEDLALALVLAAPAAALHDGPVQTIVVAAVAVSGVYALVRKRLVYVTEWLVPRLPDPALDYLPDRFVSDFVR
ncbi:metal-dependent hydrolase [Halomicrococcus sp. NG-SE-24]|uniref:metal-dependent hydrolase n=1 Tax=Halomicrococcus sp. NG-SE-24 TaxID=3436928 RepID=UPI003D98DC76